LDFAEMSAFAAIASNAAVQRAVTTTRRSSCNDFRVDSDEGSSDLGLIKPRQMSFCWPLPIAPLRRLGQECVEDQRDEQLHPRREFEANIGSYDADFQHSDGDERRSAAVKRRASSRTNTSFASQNYETARTIPNWPVRFTSS
jgi:hypothetical protein